MALHALRVDPRLFILMTYSFIALHQVIINNIFNSYLMCLIKKSFIGTWRNVNFFVPQVSFLGYLVSAKGIQVDEKRYKQFVIGWFPNRFRRFEASTGLHLFTGVLLKIPPPLWLL